ncbi:MBL fold metallo-hydrolase [Cellulomonas alba]|uniref:MBL fold metallo-hydrolase n=1 Tax=Cellulomonas alba TaxID=3053467 RepID=A0ABT7SJB1_9CELL|nr:MBL fold metallo-hydrolase [Cellulomonas alba]MDM7856260.1 MBL fold metallo-hydrolase [Cellulomonas alba]
MSWNEIVPGVYSRRYERDDLTMTVVRGERGLLLVDSGSSPAMAARIAADLQPLGEVRWLINTHAHHDHTFGNQYFASGSQRGVRIAGHHRLSAHLDAYERPRLAAWREGTGSEPARDWADVVITAPDDPIARRSWVDLGDRAVELIPLEPGHTDGDLVIRVPAGAGSSGDAWIVGDVMEEPGPPMYGSGCFPMRWPQTLASLLDEIGERDVIVPGHGRPVGRAFGVAQLGLLESTAALIRRHHAAGHDIARALASPDEWPQPTDALRLAVERGYGEIEAGIQH